MPHRNRSRRIVPPQWHDPMVDMLIDERRRKMTNIIIHIKEVEKNSGN